MSKQTNHSSDKDKLHAGKQQHTKETIGEHRSIRNKKMGEKCERKKNKYKIRMMVILLAGACILIYYFHVVLGIGTVFTHFFYIPIILAAIWWKRKGLVVALFSSGFLIFSHVFLRPDVATGNDYFRAFIFIVIAFVVAELSRRITKEEEVALRATNQQLHTSELQLRAANQQLQTEVTERVKAEEQERQQNEFLNTILESLTHPFIVINANDYTVKMTNSAAQRQHGSKLSGKLTCHMLSYMRDKPCDTTEHPCPIEEIKRTGRPVVVEHICYDKDRNPKNVEVHAYPIFDNEGKLSEIIEYSLDITERKQAEVELKHTAEEWRTTFDSITDMVSIHDKNYKFVRANKSFANAFNMKPSDIIGKTCYELIHGTKEPPPFCPHKRTLDTGKPNRREFFEPRLGIHIEASTSPLFDENGQIIASVHIAKDISKRKQAEAELKKAQKKLIDTAHRAGMAEVAADVLHNVGNILNSINVSTTVIREKVTNSELADLEKVASIINEHTDDLGTFLTEHPQGKHIPVYLTEVSKCLLDERTDIISRLRALVDNVQHIKDIVSMQQSYAKVSGVEVQTSLSKLAEDALQINSAGLERHGTRIIREFEELGDVEIDKQKVLQILVNLISNAKYALSGSKREKKLLTIRIYKHSEDHFRIEVADNGVGISEDNLAKIFSYGFTTKKDGHGVGLHSSALASKEIGGTLSVYSDGVGQGAKFTLELPFKPVEVMK